jgi:hypothetical protein
MKIRMHLLRNLLLTGTFIGLIAASSAQAGSEPTLSAQEAREELKLVVDAILEHHPNPFHAVTEAQFQAEVKKLADRQGPVLVAHQYFDLMKISSLIFDTHTQFHISEDTPGFESSFPLRFRLFPDGLYIIAGDKRYKDAIGKRVVAIGGQAAAEVIERLSHHSPADNWPRKRVFAEVFLYVPESYQYLGLTNAQGKVELELVNSSGERSMLELSHTWDKGYADFSWDTQNPFLPTDLIGVHQVLGGEVPFYLRNLADNYWYQFLEEDHKYLYLQINQQFDKSEGQAAIEFHLEWARQLLDSKTEVMIIDLRNDPGGIVNVANPIAALLSEIYFDHPNMRGVAVLFGSDTVSAGTIIIAQLEDSIRPILIGAPSGSAPNMFLNAAKQVLPYSKLKFEVSTDVYVSTREGDTRAFIAPDIPMALTFDDYLQGRDPLLEYARTVSKDLRTEIYQSASPYDPWKRDTQKGALR